MEKNNTLILMLVAGLVIISVLFAFNNGMPDTVTITENEQRETITVSETVELESMPDEAEIYIELETVEETAKAAKDVNAEITDGVLEALYDYGIEKEAVETTSYYLNEQKKWDKDTEKYIITGYQLSHIMLITIADINAAGEIIDVAVDAGATGIQSISFGLSDEQERKLKAEALTTAAHKAQAKAEALVDAVGVDLGEFVAISESSYYSRSYPYFNDRMYLASVSEESSETSISPEDVIVSGAVTLTYEIEQ